VALLIDMIEDRSFGLAGQHYTVEEVPQEVAAAA